MLSMALFTNFLMLVGTIHRATLLFLPWMLFYGLEILASWSVALAFIILPGKPNLNPRQLPVKPILVPVRFRLKPIPMPGISGS